MNVRPAGREACECASPINQILERLDQMDADIASAQQAANTAVGTATAQAGAAAASAASAQADAAAALINAGAAQDAADDAHDEAVAAAGSAQDAADDAADALLALQNIESTIASVLATDIGAKVDKLTTAGFHLYSHNGSSQGEVAPNINPTAATIPIRDSSGKLFGADPASGATDKTLVTANWVSQTGNSAPNNLVHRSGNETTTGIKTAAGHDVAIVSTYNLPSTMPRVNGTGWVKMYVSTQTNHINGIFTVQPRRANTAPGFGIIACGGHTSGQIICKWLSKDLVHPNHIDGIMVTIESDNVTVWAKNISATDTYSMREVSGCYNGNILTTETGFIEATDRTIYSMIESGGVITGYVDSDNVTHTFLFYQISS